MACLVTSRGAPEQKRFSCSASTPWGKMVNHQTHPKSYTQQNLLIGGWLLVLRKISTSRRESWALSASTLAVGATSSTWVCSPRTINCMLTSEMAGVQLNQNICNAQEYQLFTLNFLHTKSRKPKFSGTMQHLAPHTTLLAHDFFKPFHCVCTKVLQKTTISQIHTGSSPHMCELCF